MHAAAFAVARLLTSNSSSPPVPIVPVHGLLRAGLIVALFLTTLSACLFAFLLRRIANSSTGYPTKIFSLLSVFGGGVFLATCLLDLLPDAQDSLRNVEQQQHYNYRYPLVEILVAVGFLLVLTMEQVLLVIREHHWLGSSDIEHLISTHQHHDVSPDETGADDRLSSHSDYGNEVNNMQSLTSSYSTIRVLLLVMALSLHAVFEGLSLGLIGDVNEILQIFFALLVHKTIIGFSLGVRLVQSALRNTTIVLCSLVFAAQIILGGFGGIAILDFISHGSPRIAGLVSAVAQAVACGTFLYITCFEILPHEFQQRQLRIVKLLCLILGFTLIAGLLALFPDN